MQLPSPPKRKKSLFLSLALSLAGFLLILFCLNLYQYLRVKSDVASSMLQDINAKELGGLRNFFGTIEEKLTIVGDWGKNGVLDSKDTVSLNKKFFPLINGQQRISGVLLADNTGWEYFLRHKDDHWLTRITQPKGQGAIALYTSWKGPEKSLSSHEKPTRYDPRKRPWFHPSRKSGDILWTSLYSFVETGKKGITASVSWDSPKRKNSYFVFGIDISLEQIQQLMHHDAKKNGGLIFLVNATENSILPANKLSGKENAIDAKKLLAPLMDQWKTAGQPVLETIRFSYGSQQWLGSLQPLVRDKTVFWIGVAAPEKELLLNLHHTLFQIDLTDFLVATAGGMLLLLMIWKNGGFGRSEPMKVDPVVRLHALINQGEGADVEFKSTVRTNLNTGKTGKEIEFAWLKSVVAFMNSKGGTLLIGVDDTGRITGLDADNFENNDRCLLHLKNLINQHIGAEFSGFINISLLSCEQENFEREDVGEKNVLMIDVIRAGRPVFLKIGKNEEFYIRSGPSSVKLSPSQMISYVLQNTPSRKRA